jgi:hypothetical protein
MKMMSPLTSKTNNNRCLETSHGRKKMCYLYTFFLYILYKHLYLLWNLCIWDGPKFKKEKKKNMVIKYEYECI